MGRRSKNKTGEKVIIFILILTAVFSASAGEITAFYISTNAPQNKNLKMVLQIPAGFSFKDATNYRVMVLFGGRNWSGEKTIKAYDFVKLADKHKLFLLSPSFKNDRYWEPEKWSGKALLQAINKIKDKYKLNANSKIFYFGYSAGAQCTALFYSWKPEIVKAWGAYACGVWFWPKKQVRNAAPAIITCGEDDTQRFLLSKRFVRQAREHAYSLIWRSYPVGHGLSPKALALTRSFFASVLSGQSKTKYVGDDQEMDFYPLKSRNARNVDLEYRNNLPSLNFAQQWKKQ